MKQEILAFVKEALGIKDPNNHDFDSDLVGYINTALSHCWQIGIGPKEGFALEKGDEWWDDFLGEYAEDPRLNMVKTFVYMLVKRSFDNPVGTAGQSLDQSIKELEWRLTVIRDELKNEENQNE